MNSTQLEVLGIITETAIETIAKSHNTTVDAVKLALEAGQDVVCKQFQKLVAALSDQHTCSSNLQKFDPS